MSGHSKWSTIKRHKSVVDAKRSKIFTKLIKEITVAARLGGGDPSGNSRLRLAIDKAKAVSVPRDTVEKAVKRGTGELDGLSFEEVSYEGYGPGGIAMIIDCTTDNKVRTVAEIRNIFAKGHGHMGESGSVAWMFEKKGVIRIDTTLTTEDKLFEITVEAGAEDIRNEDAVFVVTTGFTDFNNVLDALKNKNIAVKEAGFEMLAKTPLAVTDLEIAKSLLELIDTLEDNDDVQNVWAAFEMDDALMERLSG